MALTDDLAKLDKHLKDQGSSLCGFLEQAAVRMLGIPPMPAETPSAEPAGTSQTASSHPAATPPHAGGRPA